MKELKDCLSPLEKLKQEIELRYRKYCYEKLSHNFLLNRIEKNNYNIILQGIEDYRIEFVDKPNEGFNIQ